MAINYLKSIDETLAAILKEMRKKEKVGVSIKVEAGKYIDNGDGTVSDPKTRLMWAKEGSGSELNFKSAEKYCKDLVLPSKGGYTDWRLPTREELLTIVDDKKFDPAIDPVFVCKSSWYWTATPLAGGTGGAWMVYFYNGRAVWDDRDSYGYVRPVRQY